MKKPTLGGCLFVHNGMVQDYCFKQSIASMRELCDEVVVLDAGSTDETLYELKQLRDEKVEIIHVSNTEWEKQKGKWKIAYFQNLAASFLTTDYYCISQADEVFHQDSFPAIRKAIETGDEAYMVTRVNLWGSVYKQLDVPLDRMPCSPQVIRIAKLGYQSVDDGENIAAPNVNMNFVNDIKLYHFGFVRDKNVMKKKIIHIQEQVFQMDHDKKLDNMDVFDWRGWFSESDLRPIEEKLPVFAQGWAKQREDINNSLTV
jgi:glycosyltransferase involved in cell wall biosynthesis